MSELPWVTHLPYEPVPVAAEGLPLWFHTVGPPCNGPHDFVGEWPDKRCSRCGCGLPSTSSGAVPSDHRSETGEN
jgi:hypothetical protein